MTPTLPIAPKTVRYIKLGAGGSFARASLDNGELQLGYHEVPHDLCAAGDWAGVLRHFNTIRRSTGKAKDSTREVQDFYTLGSDCLWITFADGLLWWGFADPEVTWLGTDHNRSASRVRRMIGGWRSTSILGVPLRMNDLTTRLTQVANYRGTICAVRAEDYLRRKINAEEEPVRRGLRAASPPPASSCSSSLMLRPPLLPRRRPLRCAPPRPRRRPRRSPRAPARAVSPS